jgi:hypothetical protein
MKNVALRSHSCGARYRLLRKLEETAQQFIYVAFNKASTRQDAEKKKVLSKEKRKMKLSPLAKRIVVRGILPAFVLSTCLSNLSWADTATVPASADFLAAIVLTKTADVLFTSGGGASAITFDGSQTTSDKLQLGTDGNLAVVGSHLVAPGSGSSAGAVTIAGTTGASVDITCSAAAVLTNASDHSVALNMDVVQITMTTGTAYGSPGATCDGTSGTPLNYTLSGTSSNNKILIGGELVADSGLTGENYSTANGGTAAPITIQAVYH